MPYSTLRFQRKYEASTDVLQHVTAYIDKVSHSSKNVDHPIFTIETIQILKVNTLGLIYFLFADNLGILGKWFLVDH